MKRVIAVTFIVIALGLGFDYLYYYAGVLYIPQKQETAYFSKVVDDELYIDRGNGFEEFKIRGVNMGLGKPGYYATEKKILKEEYLRWFSYIQEMGANVIRVYTLQSTDFYEAFYEYNANNQKPLYLLHGVWVDDYLINSNYSVIDKDFYEPFFKSCKMTVDVIHGRHKQQNSENLLSAVYEKDISQWVYGYILGIEWEPTLVSYTNRSFEQLPQYDGKYLYTENATNFEVFLAEIGDRVLSYEATKYGEQRVIAFANWATTDPFEYDDRIMKYFEKFASVDVEKIKSKDAFLTGQFASYHIYPYYPDYYCMKEEHEENTYLEYLCDINEHHTMPVVITEFGVPSSRGQAAVELGLGRNQGGMSETDQGNALVSMYQDIMAAGSNGGIVFTWQDEWFKRTWNTMAKIDLKTTPYWSDYQTNEQYFGLLSFDPGEEQSICYVDGDISDWDESDYVTGAGGVSLSMKYDEKFIYFLAEQEGYDLMFDRFFIPIDTTMKSGSKKAENLNISMSDAADFIIEIRGKANSRVWVQERYNMLEALFYDEITPYNIFSQEFPVSDSNRFDRIFMLLQWNEFYEMQALDKANPKKDKALENYEYDLRNPYHYSIMKTYETGHLTYGNANPSADNFNSLADFCAGDGFVEIKIPWQLLNFADPSKMYIHDDYYEVYGVEYLKIDSMKVGVGTGEKEIQMEDFELEPLGKKPKYHERLKESYYILKEFWTGE